MTSHDKRSFCAWCDRYYVGADGGIPIGPVLPHDTEDSHGMCAECSAKIEATFERILNEEPPPRSNPMSKEELAMARRTAMARPIASVPVRDLYAKGLIRGRVLDFGSGRGADAKFLRSKGFKVDAYDPNYTDFELPNRPVYDTILCTYVFNVTPSRVERELLAQIRANLKVGGTAFITVRSDVAQYGQHGGPSGGGKFQRDVRLTFPIKRTDSTGRTYQMNPKCSNSMCYMRKAGSYVCRDCGRNFCMHHIGFIEANRKYGTCQRCQMKLLLPPKKNPPSQIGPPPLAAALREVARDKAASPDARADAVALLIGDVEKAGGDASTARTLLGRIAAGARDRLRRALEPFMVRSNPPRKKALPKWTAPVLPGGPELRLFRISPGIAGPKISGGEDAAKSFAYLALQHHEEFWIALLNGKHRIVGRYMVSRGNVGSSAVYPSEVLRVALHAGVNRIILAHNHPSGDPMPSPDDIEITKRIIKACALIGDMNVLDSVVVAQRGTSTPISGSVGVVTITGASEVLSELSVHDPVGSGVVAEYLEKDERGFLSIAYTSMQSLGLLFS